MDTISETLAPNIPSAMDASVSEMQQTHTDRHLIVQPHRGCRHLQFAARILRCRSERAKATALWRLPGTGDICAVVDLDKVNELTHIDFHRRHAGFVFAPFVTGRRNAAYRIDADVIYTPDGLRLRDAGDNSPAPPCPAALCRRVCQVLRPGTGRPAAARRLVRAGGAQPGTRRQRGRIHQPCAQDGRLYPGGRHCQGRRVAHHPPAAARGL